jgi:hypothetical protein
VLSLGLKWTMLPSGVLDYDPTRTDGDHVLSLTVTDSGS